MTYTPKLTFADYLALADTGLARRAESTFPTLDLTAAQIFAAGQ